MTENHLKSQAGLEVITSTAKEEISKLTQKDVVVIWEGTNDIAKFTYHSWLYNFCS
jgi:hypothetical protein